MLCSHRFVAALSLTTLIVLSTRQPPESQAQPSTSKPQWIWTNEATLQSAPSGNRYFRKVFKLDAAPADATLKITADNTYHVWINGSDVGAGNEWHVFSSYKIAKLLRAGENVIAVEGGNDGESPAGLLVELKAKLKGQTVTVLSDASWKTSKEAPKNWQNNSFDDAKWNKAKVLAAFGEGPWGNLGVASPGGAKPGVFTVPEGFRVETVVPSTVELLDGKKDPIQSYRLTLVNMCFDPKGRIFVSQENGPVLMCTEPNKAGECQKVAVYCDQVKNCQGMCWINDYFYLVGNGPKGVVGVYRGHEAKSGDRLGTVELVVRVNGGMGDHGPHAVLEGPDGKLYLVIGNHAASNRR